MPTVVQLSAGKALTVRVAADVFLDSLGNRNTVRTYGIGVGKTAERLGEARPLASVADDEIGEALELLWGSAAVNTWNSRRAGVLSWLGWCRERGYEGPMVPVWAKRLSVPDSETPARSKMAIDRLVARREVHLREKTLWRMLYETAGRAEEILGVNVEDLDFAGRRCPVKAKGARSKARRRGQAREDFVLETVYWDAGTARLLPRLLKGRTRGPARGRARLSALVTCARIPGWPGCRTGRPAPFSTSTPPCADRARAGTCTNTVTPASPTWARPGPAC